jgi:hypothetical protein
MAERETKAQLLGRLSRKITEVQLELAEARKQHALASAEAMRERDLRYRAEGRAQAWEAAFLAVLEGMGGR